MDACELQELFGQLDEAIELVETYDNTEAGEQKLAALTALRAFSQAVENEAADLESVEEEDDEPADEEDEEDDTE